MSLSTFPRAQISASSSPNPGESLESPLSTEHWNAIRLILILDQIVCPLFKKILLEGTQKETNKTLKAYLFGREIITTETKYKKEFNASQREKIETDPSCETFDISLLVRAIKLGCDDVAKDNEWFTEGTFENLLQKLKNHRNDLMHNKLWLETEKFREKLEDMRTVVLACSQEAYSKYKIPFDENEVNVKINSVRDNPYGDLDLNISNNSLLFKRLSKLLADEGRKDLVELLKKLSHLNPASMIIGLQIQLAVSGIFTELEIVKAGRNEMCENIPYSDILQYASTKKASDKAKQCQVILIEGNAGSGKTTLIKFFMSDWVSDSHSVKEIGEYKLIIPIDFRNSAISSFQDLIGLKMPRARKAFKTLQDMQHCLLDLPFMIFMDGMDEINNASKALFKEILELMEGRNCILICTTRPEKVEEFYMNLPNDFNVIHLKIKGVPEGCAINFLEKYHIALKDFDIGQEDTDELINYFRTRGKFLGDFWKLPLNLALLALLWSVDPDRVKQITTSINLLREMNKLIKGKLLNRLYNKGDDFLSLEKLKRNLEQFTDDLHENALSELCSDAILLQEETLRHLEGVCYSLGLLKDEVMGAFFNRENVWSSATETSKEVSFPQRSWQEFYSSLHICRKVTTKTVDYETAHTAVANTLSQLRVPTQQVQIYLDTLTQQFQGSVISTEPVTIRDILSNAHRDNQAPLNLNKFQNMLIMLLGVFHEYQDRVSDSLITELVELITEAGVKDRAQWLQVLNNAQCDERVASLIAQMPGIIEGTIRIHRQDTCAYATLLKEKRPERIVLEMMGKASEILRLPELLEIIGKNRDQVKCLSFSYLHGTASNSVTEFTLTDVVDRMMVRCCIREYKGPLTSEMKLSEALRWLEVRIDNKESFENLFTHLSRKLNRLETLSVCLPTTIDPQTLRPLPGTRTNENSSNSVFHLTVDLLLLDIRTEIDFRNAADIARSLQPVSGNRMFRRIVFHRIELDSKDTKLDPKQFQGIRTCSVEFPSSLVFSSQEARGQFADQFKKAVGCRNVSWNRKQSLVEEW